MNGRIILSVIGAGLAATLAARSSGGSSVQWQKTARACEERGEFVKNARGESMHCTGLKYLVSDEPAELSLTGVVPEANKERIDARVEYLQPNGKTTTHTTDFRMLVLAVDQDVGPRDVSLVFNPGGGPDDPPGGALEPLAELPPLPETETKRYTYGVCYREYADEDVDVSEWTPGKTLRRPTNVDEAASIYRFRTFGLNAEKYDGPEDLDKAFLTHDPKIVLRAKSGDDTQQSPFPADEEPTYKGHIECCPGMPLRSKDCSCELGRILVNGSPPGPDEDRCDFKGQCIYNWEHNQGQFGCPDEEQS